LCSDNLEEDSLYIGLGKLAGRLQREQPHYGAYPIGFSHSFPTRPLGGRRYIRASILKRNAALVLLVDCLRQRLAVWAWKLAVCQRPTLSRFLPQVNFLHARARSYTPTSRPTACIAAKNGFVSMAMLALRCRVHFQEEISICLAADGHDGPSFHFSRPIQPTAC
jgi:hypothetical protein